VVSVRRVRCRAASLAVFAIPPLYDDKPDISGPELSRLPCDSFPAHWRSARSNIGLHFFLTLGAGAAMGGAVLMAAIGSVWAAQEAIRDRPSYWPAIPVGPVLVCYLVGTGTRTETAGRCSGSGDWDGARSIATNRGDLLQAFRLLAFGPGEATESSLFAPIHRGAGPRAL